RLIIRKALPLSHPSRSLVVYYVFGPTGLGTPLIPSSRSVSDGFILLAVKLAAQVCLPTLSSSLNTTLGKSGRKSLPKGS
ncbi:hypothetical protein FOZ63_002103, partial [Perkinsus olseni]